MNDQDSPSSSNSGYAKLIKSDKIKARIVIIGAGISGLTVANHLIDSNLDAISVTLISRAWPGDDGDVDYPYASPWAGAHWRSFTDDAREQQIERDTFHYLEQHGHKLDGVTKYSGLEYFSQDRANVATPWFKDLCPRFETLAKADLPKGVAKGFKFNTFTFNVPLYLKFLQKRLANDPSVTLIRDTVAHFPNGYNVVINCTGISAGRLDMRETGMYPIRGQASLVHCPGHAVTATYMIAAGLYRYAIPRGDGTVILGGTYGVNDYDREVREDTAQSILRDCKQTWPALKEAKVLEHYVAFRPARKGGLRLEEEWRNGQVVIHNYGHGPAGYQQSWGCAMRVVDMVERILAMTKAAKL